jgi:hypothetical protein
MKLFSGIVVFLLQCALVSCSDNVCRLFDGSNRYVEGEWAFRNESQMKIAVENGEFFECCELKHSLIWNPFLNSVNPMNEFEVCKEPYAPKVDDSACTCREEYYSGENARLRKPGGYRPDYAKYEWKPKSCELIPWSAKLFCQAIGDRKLLFIGDSTMAQTHSTLASMIYQSSELPSLEQRRNCLDKMTFQRSDYLVYHFGEWRGTSLIETVRKANFSYDLIVMSTGPHYDYRETGSLEKPSYASYFFPKLIDTIEVIKETTALQMPPRKVSYFWKTENPGHPDCFSFPKPLPILESKEEMLTPSKFHWIKHYHMNQLIQNRSKEFDLQILSMEPLYLRPDGHPLPKGDCLHYCAPGPLNYFARIFLQGLVNEEI